jgi:hypothetical protein
MKAPRDEGQSEMGILRHQVEILACLHEAKRYDVFDVVWAAVISSNWWCDERLQGTTERWHY